MDRERERAKDDSGYVLTNEEDKSQINGGHQTLPRNKEKTRRTTSLDLKRAPIHLRVTSRRARINPQKKRVNYINRLERLWTQLDTIISNPQTTDISRIKAMNTLIRCLYIVYGMVEAAEIEQLETEIEEFEKEEENRRTQEQIGYNLPDPTS